MTLTRYEPWNLLDQMRREMDRALDVRGDAGSSVATSDWVPGEIIVARYAIPWPEELSIEEAGLNTGFYYLPTMEPLGEMAVLAGPGELTP